MLKINEATKSFAGIVAVDKCSFEIKQGAITALIGPNGAGKTTMFNCISHICHIDSGQIFYNNHRLDLMPTHKIARLGIGRSFQITRTLDQLSVTENLVLHTAGGIGSHLFHQDITTENRLKASEVMEFLGISTLADVDMGELSFGQKKLLDLGAVLMADPDLILLDEPAAGVNLRLLEDRGCRATDMEGAHGQLGAGFANGLCGDNAHRLTQFDQLAGSQIVAMPHRLQAE